MITARRSLIALFIPLFCLSIARAQQEGADTQSPAPLVTATASASGVDYVSVGRVHQTRLQVFSPDGRQVSDSDFQLGNLVSWRLQDQQGSRLKMGAYLYLITVKDFSGGLTQKYGIAVLEQEHIYLQQAARDELPPAQATALEANKQAAALTAVDRVGAFGLKAANTAPADGGTAVDAAPAGNNGTASQTTPGGENISGTGTANNLAKWLDDNGTLGNSDITEDASGRVSIGPRADLPIKLNVFSPFGTIPFSFTQDAPASQSPTLALFSTSDGPIGQYAATTHNNAGTFLMGATSGKNFGLFANNSYTAPHLFIRNDGRTGIGTIDPFATLHVRGPNGGTDSNGLGLSALSPLRVVGGDGGSGVGPFGGNDAARGGSPEIFAGNGGNSQNAGGHGGFVHIAGGNGGVPAGTGRSGGGGSLTLDAGDAGNFSTSTVGGEGGGVRIRAGTGGSNINGVGGPGGRIFIQSGRGGVSHNGSGSGLFGDIQIGSQGGNVGIGEPPGDTFGNPRAKLHVWNGDVFISTQSRGLILRATDGANCYRLTVNNAGVLVTTLIPCP
jgi:hypothetical protein